MAMMLRPRWRLRVGTSLLITMISAAAQNSNGTVVHRDWQKYPAVVEIDTQQEVFAIGDVHADNDRLVHLLKAAKIVDPHASASGELKWIAGKAVVVFTGDMIDKGPKSVEVLKSIISLCESASLNGGRVIALMGNHEAEFLAAPASPKVKDFAADLHKAGIVPEDVAACQGELGSFLCSLPIGARVRDWFFSHGGNTGGRTIQQLAADIQSGFEKDGFGTSQLIGDNSILEARLGAEGPNGKSWFEFDVPRRNSERVLKGNAAALGVKHIVQGHQHQDFLFEDGIQRNRGEMFQWQGLLFLIDTGMSEQVGDSEGAALHIRSGNRGHAVAVCADGRKIELWDPVTKPESGSAAICGPSRNSSSAHPSRSSK